jgi:phage-related protein
MIVVVKSCQKEIAGLPESIREDLADGLARLAVGLQLSMPLSRPVPSIGKGVHELRLRDRTGTYRVFYALKGRGMIYLLHATKKTTQETPARTIHVVKWRLEEVDR